MSPEEGVLPHGVPTPWPCRSCDVDQDAPNDACPSWERGMGLHPREGLSCPRCHTDTHRCRGCGEPTEHSTKDVCVRCRNTL